MPYLLGDLSPNQQFINLMNIYTHTTVSFALSAILMVLFRKTQMSVACFLAGILIDLDHIPDYFMNYELMNILRLLRHPRKFLAFLVSGYVNYKPDYKSYKFLHSIELSVTVPLLYIFGVWNAVATGIAIGFIAHLILDALPLGYFGQISLIYKARNGFPTGDVILKKRLSRVGTDVKRCQLCNANGDVRIHRDHSWYTGFTRKGLSKLMILCSDCHDVINNRKD